MTLAPAPVKQYIKQHDRGYWIEDTRISLDSVVYSFLNGESPESIAQNFPLLSLEQVYGAIAFYLANREMVDVYLQEGEAEFQLLQQSFREKSPLLYQKLNAARVQKQSLT
ncbi:DUF433 domain-containing protein [Altericista sp. CCNU0014]|uniref:DUF433 domain-containing protein n=1 Tax=Altericista sp. CCNU0014 TaxID=3082949 RepID=UPI00384D12D4